MPPAGRCFVHGCPQRGEAFSDRVGQVLLPQLAKVAPVGIDQALLHRTRANEHLQRRLKSRPNVPSSHAPDIRKPLFFQSTRLGLLISVYKSVR